MSQWRRNALEQVPTCKSLIEEAENPMALWIELLFKLEYAYEAQPPEEETIRQIYAYALWCWHRSKNGDLTTAVACAFFEHLPLHEKVSSANDSIGSGNGLSAQSASSRILPCPS